MCGIAGYVGVCPPAKEYVDRCLSLMARRGPDDAQVYCHGEEGGRKVLLLHTRLSILDISSRARQPFTYNNTVLCYNGEIFNYKELRNDLRKLGDTFYTECDTEVLSHLLEREGGSALDRCEGMWAFAFLDKSDGTLILSRDRFGEKPLYIFEDQTGIYFASEIKFLSALVRRRFELNQEQICRYLVNGYKSLYKCGETFFRSVKELAPGSILKIDAKGFQKRSIYWKPSFDQSDDYLSFDEAVEGARKALKRSVEIRLRTDVPLAFCLSGGVDSNALVGIATNLLGRDVHGFTILNTDDRYEEKDLVATAVEAFGIKHTAMPLEKKNFLDRLRTLIRYHDAPVYTITYFAHWQLMEAVAAEGYKVVISGTGADELFSGYYDHHNAYLYEMRDQAHYDTALRNWQRLVQPVVRNPYLKDPDYFGKNPKRRDHIYLDAEEFSKNIMIPFSEPFLEKRYSSDLLRNRMANELMHESVPVILHEDDLNAMYYSMENRSPFLDRSLFEWCQRIPTRHLIEGGTAKAILRKAVQGIAPTEIINNPRKIGFNAPVLDFLDVNDPNVLAVILDDSKIFDLVDKVSIESLVTSKELPNSKSKFLFNFVNAKLFIEEYGP